MKKKCSVVYGEDGSGRLIFLPEETARELAGVYAAIQEAKTWGEFRARAGERYYRRLVEFGQGEGRGLKGEPGAGEPFRRDLALALVADYQEGESSEPWPDYPPSLMAEWLPEAVLDELGEEGSDPYGLEAADIEWENLEAVLKALAVEGYEAHRDDRLIQEAAGDLLT